MRRLVVNADDLGLTIGVNDGIFDAHEHGILISASLLANAPATADAARLARSPPTLGVGVHLTLVDGDPVLPPDHVPTLVEDDERFRRSWKPFIVACLTGRVSMLEVEHELTAQIERVLAAGIKPTHLDAHKHVRGHPRRQALGLQQATTDRQVLHVDLAMQHPSILAGPQPLARILDIWYISRHEGLWRSA